RSHLSAAVDVRAHGALAGRAAGLLHRRRHALLAQEVDRLLDVAAGLGERRLAIHHPRAGALAELFHHLGRDLHDCLLKCCLLKKRLADTQIQERVSSKLARLTLPADRDRTPGPGGKLSEGRTYWR